MERIHQQLNRETFEYVTKMFASLKHSILFAWLPFVLIALIGVFILLTLPDKGVGWGLLIVGVSGAIFFKVFTNKTTFKVQPQLYKHTGILRCHFVSAGRASRLALYVDDYPLMMPDALEIFIIQMVKRHDKTPVEVTLATMNFNQNGKNTPLYTPLRIADDFCLAEALEKHGKFLFLKDSLKSIFVIIFFMILVTFLLVSSDHLSSKIENEYLGPVIYVASMLGAVLLSLWLTNKLASFYNTQWDKMLVCDDKAET